MRTSFRKITHIIVDQQFSTCKHYEWPTSVVVSVSSFCSPSANCIAEIPKFSSFPALTSHTSMPLFIAYSTPLISMWKTKKNNHWYCGRPSETVWQGPMIFKRLTWVEDLGFKGRKWFCLKESQNITGWWFYPSWNILVNGKDYCIPYIGEHKIHVWNHQPDKIRISDSVQWLIAILA